MTPDAGVQLKRSPIIRLMKIARSMNQRQLRFAKGYRGGLSGTEVIVKLIHHLCGRQICHIPKPGDDMACAGLEKRPREPDHPFAGIDTGSGPPAGGNCYEVRMKGDLCNVPGVE